MAVAATQARRQLTVRGVLAHKHYLIVSYYPLQERLCHLCRDSHPAWKGIICNQCSAFFCFRGLHRHFDIDLISFLRNGDSWHCPKCECICNCRCCHFHQPYQSKDKPVRARIKPVDTRGRIFGFVDNVFDQKRGKRASLAVTSASPNQDLSHRGVKRSRAHKNVGEPEGSGQHRDAFAVLSAEPRGTRSLDTSNAFPVTMATHSQNDIGQTPSRAFDPLGPFRRENQSQTESPLSEIRRSSRSSETHPGRYPHLPPPTSFTSVLETPMSSGPAERADPKGDATEEESIHDLESKLEALRGYANDILELSLVESHAKILDRVSQLETEIEKRKRRKTELLLSKLDRDFPDLADLAREEARRRGV